MNCLYCGQPITKKSHHKGNERKYCSIECFKKARGCREYGTAVCMFCGEEFRETRDRPNKFCSNHCAMMHRQMQERLDRMIDTDVNPEAVAEYEKALEKLKEAAERIKRERRCRECGDWFISRHGRTYCSDACARRANNRMKEKRIERNGKPDRSITLTKLYMRDGGVCQICGRNISFDCNSNSDRYPSIDHIKPLAKGGLHRWDNVQLACRICNSMKADEMEEE